MPLNKNELTIYQARNRIACGFGSVLTRGGTSYTLMEDGRINRLDRFDQSPIAAFVPNGWRIY